MMRTDTNPETLTEVGVSTAGISIENPPRATDTEDTVDMLELGILLARRKWFIMRTGLILAVLTAIITLIMKPTFTAKTYIMTPRQSKSPLEQLGALSALAGVGGSAASELGLKNPDDLYIGMLHSETVADALIQRFHLMQVYHSKKLSLARTTLKNNTKIVSEKSSLISIAVEDHDPKRAAAMANAYVEQLHDLMGHLAITEAAQRRVFFEQQLEQEKDRLADAEVALVQTEQKTGIIQPTGQAQVVISSIAQLRAQIAANRVQLKALETSATPQNPEVIRLQSQIAALEAQLAGFENGNSDTPATQDSVEIPTAKVPAASLEYIRKMRDVRYHETLFDLLARQYEIAKVDEAKAGEIVQVVDPALVPDRKSWPPRTLLVLLAGILGVLFAAFWVILEAGYRQRMADPEQAAKLHEFRTALRLRR
ncbi:MAG TPA: GNVR domain-containing protein [Acidobacteriaceae bacterium]|jgi:uncharacterized protein involved in exopolysaccharide biosynthesis|nr:GNVR domain-containing protein [Acidobacteriaceae bacterium]